MLWLRSVSPVSPATLPFLCFQGFQVSVSSQRLIGRWLGPMHCWNWDTVFQVARPDQHHLLPLSLRKVFFIAADWQTCVSVPFISIAKKIQKNIYSSKQSIQIQAKTSDTSPSVPMFMYACKKILLFYSFKKKSQDSLKCLCISSSVSGTAREPYVHTFVLCLMVNLKRQQRKIFWV
jgi:hypothetical protein